MNLMGLKTTPAEASQIFATVDKDGDGRISLQEFINYIGNWNKSFAKLSPNQSKFNSIWLEWYGP